MCGHQGTDRIKASIQGIIHPAKLESGETWIYFQHQKCHCSAGGMTQVVLHLPSKHKALSSNSSTAKKKKHTEMLLFIQRLNEKQVQE
jgi:hypothetical protein